MTFKEFEKIVQERQPNIKVFQQYKNKVSVVFNPSHGKMYEYSANYCQVLNKLGIKAIYEHDLESITRYLEMLKEGHGKEDIWLGGICDNSELIAKYEAILADYKQNYIVVKG